MGSHRIEYKGKTNRMNLLEWLSDRGFPDAVRNMLISISVLFTLSPYFGGRTFGFFGANPLTIQNVPADLFWWIVFFGSLSSLQNWRASFLTNFQE